MTEMISIGGDSTPLQSELAKSDAQIEKRRQKIIATRRDITQLDAGISRIESKLVSRLKSFGKTTGKGALGSLLLDGLARQDEGDTATPLSRIATNAGLAFAFVGGGPQGVIAAAFATAVTSIGELRDVARRTEQRLKQLEDKREKLQTQVNDLAERVASALESQAAAQDERTQDEIRKARDEVDEMIYQVDRHAADLQGVY